MEEKRKELIKIVVDARTKKGITRTKLCELVDSAQSTMYLLETKGVCSVTHLYKVCKVLDLDLKKMIELMYDL